MSPDMEYSNSFKQVQTPVVEPDLDWWLWIAQKMIIQGAFAQDYLNTGDMTLKSALKMLNNIATIMKSKKTGSI